MEDEHKPGPPELLATVAEIVEEYLKYRGADLGFIVVLAEPNGPHISCASNILMDHAMSLVRDYASHRLHPAPDSVQ